MTPLIGAADVAAAARETLKTYLPAHLARGIGGRAPLPEPTSYNEVPTTEAIRFVKKSVLAVVASQTVGTPDRFGDGTYDAVWLLTVAVWHEQTPTLPLLTAAADYVTAVRATVVQHPTLGGLASEVTWTGETVDLVGDGQTASTLGYGLCEFTVRVPQVVDETPLSGVGADGPESTESTVYVNPSNP